MPTISIAMPAYNAGKYIAAAIESIIIQTYTDWELIICDDCSTDNTIDIIESYQKEHANIKLIKRDTNSGGCRLPRFDAILAAEGDFVCPVDSDDIIEERYLEKLIYRQQETNADIILGRMIICNEELIPISTSIPNKNYNIGEFITGKEACRRTIGKWQIAMNGLLTSNTLYKAFIESSDLATFSGAFADEIDHRRLLLLAETVVTVDAHYLYRQQPSSIVHSISANSYKSLNACANLLYFVIKTFTDDKELITKAHDEYFEKLYRAQQKFYYHNAIYSNKEKEQISKIIEQHYNHIKGYKLTFSRRRDRFLSIAFPVFKTYTWFVNRIIKLKS